MKISKAEISLERGSWIKITTPVTSVYGVVASAAYYPDWAGGPGAWYIELFSINGYHYWKQDEDKGRVELIDRAAASPALIADLEQITQKHNLGAA